MAVSYTHLDVYKRQELYRTELVEKICELDDDLMMAYLEGEENDETRKIRIQQ